MGAWIETDAEPLLDDNFIVAPLVGAWIETGYKVKKDIINGGRTPRGCVD